MKIANYKQNSINSVIVGLSGGPDSVALTLLLKEQGLKIFAIHCNFHLRGSESERDSQFTQDFCSSHGITLRIFDFDAMEYATKKKISVEMACRELRYEKFREIKRELRADRIAVGHNADDNAETLFLNLMRGTGIKGLRGMLPDNGEIIRPLLQYSRDEILAYLRLKKQTYITDSSNLESDYRRNYIRNLVFPLLKKEWPGFLNTVTKTIGNLREEEIVLETVKKNLLGEQPGKLEYSTINNFVQPEWLIFEFIRKYGGRESQAGEIYRAIRSEEFISGKKWIVEKGIISAERTHLEYVEETERNFGVKCQSFEMTGELYDEILNSSLSRLWTTLPPSRIEFRHAESGDRIEALGMRGSTTVSKIMKDAKLTQSQKEKIIVALDNESGKIIWVEGLKRSRHFIVKKETAQVLKYEIIKDKDYENR